MHCLTLLKDWRLDYNGVLSDMLVSFRKNIPFFFNIYCPSSTLVKYGDIVHSIQLTNGNTNNLILNLIRVNKVRPFELLAPTDY